MKLVWDKADCTLDINGIAVVAAPRAYPPFACQAYAEEQDTQLVLGEQSVLRDPGKPSWYLTRGLQQDDGYPLGSVIIKGGTPLRLLAVVHDLDQEPSYSPEAVAAAYQSLVRIAQQRELHALAVPLLGNVHGRLRADDSLRYLCNALSREAAGPLRQIWLMVPETCDCVALLSPLKTG